MNCDYGRSNERGIHTRSDLCHRRVGAIHLRKRWLGRDAIWHGAEDTAKMVVVRVGGRGGVCGVVVALVWMVKNGHYDKR